jgi:hypothetical protein
MVSRERERERETVDVSKPCLLTIFHMRTVGQCFSLFWWSSWSRRFGFVGFDFLTLAHSACLLMLSREEKR